MVRDRFCQGFIIKVVASDRPLNVPSSTADVVKARGSQCTRYLSSSLRVCVRKPREGSVSTAPR